MPRRQRGARISSRFVAHSRPPPQLRVAAVYHAIPCLANRSSAMRSARSSIGRSFRSAATGPPSQRRRPSRGMNAAGLPTPRHFSRGVVAMPRRLAFLLLQ